MDIKRLSDQLIIHESLETHAYTCSANAITIGVGRNIDKNGGLGITEDEARYLLKNDINRVESELQAAYGWFSELDDVRKEALVNMVFNLGLTRFNQFKATIKHIENRDYELAGAEALNSRWAEQVGQRAIDVANQLASGNPI
tara:strand:- start:880 stop:1308 length:429 start_codon:yes stop_codon:yes gene_type:complete